MNNNQKQTHKVTTLSDHIDEWYAGRLKKFAFHNEISEQLARHWVKKGYLVVDGVLCSPNRTVKIID